MDIISVLFAILVFSLLVFFHELGHFTAAKLSGVQVNEFALFMGPAIFKKKIGETLYSLRCIPIGGYCAMEGEDEDTENPRSFQKAAWWKRLIILVAGAAMNLIMGFLLIVLVYSFHTVLPEPVIASSTPESLIIHEDGLQVGDRILEIDGETIYISSDFSMLLSFGNEYHDITVERNGEKVFLDDFHMQTYTTKDEQGQDVQLYGITFHVVQNNLPNLLSFCWRSTVDFVRNVRLSLQMLISGQAGLQDMTGPVGLISVMSDTAQNSESVGIAVLNMLYFGGFISVNLAVMNMLPIPALDGGRVVGLLLTTLIEKILRRKINPKYEGYIHGVGMILLLLLMAVILFKDVFVIFKG